MLPSSKHKPGPDFDEDNRAPVFPIPVSYSTELWLIQWPLNHLKPGDFHGKELSLRLHRDGNMTSFESSSGKSYEVVSFTSQEPDATVFLPTSSSTKAVGKISRRVSLVRYPEPGEFDKSSFSKPNLLSGSRMKSLSHLSAIHGHSQTGTDKSSRETVTSSPGIFETPPLKSGKKKHIPPSESARSNGRSSLASQPESQMTSATTVGSAQSHGGKSKRRKIKELQN